jgi:hypothetical protein
MVSSQKKTQGVPRKQGTDILPAIRELLNQEARIGSVEAHPEGYSSRDSFSSPDSLSSSDSLDEGARNEFHAAPSITPAGPSLGLNIQQASLQSNRISTERPSVVWRVFHTVARGFIVIAMASAAFALLSYGDDKQRDLVRARDLTLSWLSSILRSDSYQGSDAAADPVSELSNQTPSQNATLPTEAPVIHSTEASVATGSSPELQHQLDTTASDLVVVRRLVEGLAAREDQMAQDIASLQTAEQNVSQKLSSLPQSLTVRIPRKKLVRAARR